MKYALLILLTTAIYVYGQPVEGPWVVMEVDTSTTLFTPLITPVDSSTARVFVSSDSMGSNVVLASLYDLEDHILTNPLETVRLDTMHNYLDDAEIEGTQSWIVVFHRQHTVDNSQTMMVSGHQDARIEYSIGSSYPGNQYFAGQIVSRVNLTPRISGGWLLTYVIQRIPPPYYENESQIYVVGVSPDSVEYRQPLIPYEQQLFGPTQAAAVSISRDTSLVFTQALWGQGWSMGSVLLKAIAGADSNTLDTVCTYACRLSATDFRSTENEGFLTYSAESGSHSSLYRIDEMRSCEAVGSLAFDYVPERLTFQQGHGYAALWRNPSWIKIARIGIDGTTSEPGIFYWRSSDYRIGDADLAVLNDGRVYVIWTEAANGSANATRLMAAWMNWDTPLAAAPQPEVVGSPSSFALSAYPNPFNNELQIRYELPRTGIVNLAVFNVLGQQVAKLENGMRTAGAHQATWSATGGSGIYFVRLQTEVGVRTEKVLLAR